MVAVARLEENRQFVESYIRKFKGFSESYAEDFDRKQYEWLTHRVMKIQVLSGDARKWRQYGEEFPEEATRKSDQFANMLDQMGQQPIAIKTVTSTTSFLIRFLGVLDDFIERCKSRRINPFIMFREGIQLVVLGPLLVFSWARGAEGEMVLARVEESDRFGRWVAYLSLAGVIVPLAILTVGWEPLSAGFAYGWDLVNSGYSMFLDAITEFLQNPPTLPTDTAT
jgi:hypothetical protein